jgi:hypothetical protein
MGTEILIFNHNLFPSSIEFDIFLVLYWTQFIEKTEKMDVEI